MTDADKEIIAVIVAIAYTTEEADEFAVVLIRTHPCMVAFIGQERTILQVVPEISLGREVLVASIEAISYII